jgi:hypothetical protein
VEAARPSPLRGGVGGGGGWGGALKRPPRARVGIRAVAASAGTPAPPPPSPAPSPQGGGEDASPSASSTRLGRNPASVLPAPVGATSRAERPAFALARRSSWCARGAQPRPANQARKRSGRKSAGSDTVER